jgi:hypothetical protein
MTRIFKESWSSGLKQSIANMTDSEYKEWEETFSKAGKTEGGRRSKVDTPEKIEASIQNWADSKKA